MTTAARAGRAGARRPDRVGRRRARRLRDAARADRLAQVRGRGGGRLRRRHAGARSSSRCDGEERTVELAPVYDAPRTTCSSASRSATHRAPSGPLEAAERSVDQMWLFTTKTVETIAGIFEAEKREEISGVVGSYEVTRQTIELDDRARALSCWRSSPCRSGSSTCSRSCRSTAGTSSGRWPRRSAAARSRSA